MSRTEYGGGIVLAFDWIPVCHDSSFQSQDEMEVDRSFGRGEYDIGAVGNGSKFSNRNLFLSVIALCS